MGISLSIRFYNAYGGQSWPYLRHCHIRNETDDRETIASRSDMVKGELKVCRGRSSVSCSSYTGLSRAAGWGVNWWAGKISYQVSPKTWAWRWRASLSACAGIRRALVQGPGLLRCSSNAYGHSHRMLASKEGGMSSFSSASPLIIQPVCRDA